MTPSEGITKMIGRLADWRGNTLAGIRKSILATDPEIPEDWKWMGSPAWSRDGLIAVASILKGKVKLTFSNGAGLSDPHKIFNAGFQGREN